MAKWHGCGSSETEVGIPGPGLAVCSASHSFTLRFKSVRSARVCHGTDLVLTFKLKRSSWLPTLLAPDALRWMFIRIGDRLLHGGKI